MKLVIFGSRDITNVNVVEAAIKNSGINLKDIEEIISGAARGVDTLAIKYAEENKIPIKRFPAEWNKWGKRAGMVRNKEMAKYADFGIAIWDSVSVGTKNMIELMNGKVFVYLLD